MVVLVTGGSGSGKSAYAEEYLEMLSKADGALDTEPLGNKYYIAAMKATDKEGWAKIKRHQKLRSGKGFITIEQPCDIHETVEKLNQNAYSAAGALKSNLPKRHTAIVECMSNLVANEMFSHETPASCEWVTDKVIEGIEQLNKALKHLVIVTNNIFEDGIVYEEATMEYIRAMGTINEKIAAMADKVVEVVVGIPIMISKEE